MPIYNQIIYYCFEIYHSCVYKKRKEEDSEMK